MAAGTDDGDDVPEGRDHMRFSLTPGTSDTVGEETLRQLSEAAAEVAGRVAFGQQVRQRVDRVDQIHNVFIGQQGVQVGEVQVRTNRLAEQRQKFHFDFLNHTLKQSEWTFRLSVWFMTGGALVILAGAILALVHAGNPDLSYLPLVTSLTGALITVGGGALALHSKRTMANLTKAAEDNEAKIDIDHKLEIATTFIDRVADSKKKDDLNSAAAMKALGMDAAPEMMVNRLLPEPPKEIDPGGSSG